MSNAQQDNSHSIDKSQSIRHKLYSEEISNWKRYSLLATGDTSAWKLFKYEIIVFLFGSVPGALGLALRQKFYPRLFKETGRGVVFGRNLVIRNANNIKLGNRVVIDDQTLIDARGARKGPGRPHRCHRKATRRGPPHGADARRRWITPPHAKGQGEGVRDTLCAPPRPRRPRLLWPY